VTFSYFMQYGIPSTEFRRTLTIFCNQGPNVRASIHLLELFILNEYAARYTVARHYLGQYSDICDLVSYPPSFSESHLFVCDFHFSLHSDPFQYDPKKDLACICMGDKSNCSVICTLFKITSLGSVMRSPHIFCAFCPVLSLLLLRQLPSIVLLGPHQDLWLCDLLSDG